VSEVLGRVERPAVENFRDRRKLLVVFLVYPYEAAPEGYGERCERYWKQVDEQVRSLESKIGAVRHIYHESVYESGDKGLELLEKVNRYSHEVARVRSEGGAVMEAFEDRELAAELSDWGRFMMLGFASGKVAELVRDMHLQAEKRRNEHAMRVVDETLKPDEVGLLFVSEGHRFQFPGDIEVFSVVPPALDDLHRWLRDEAERLNREAAEVQHAPEEAEQQTGSNDQEVA
jgi:hypothetical protein